jgi:hypothetical protein
VEVVRWSGVPPRVLLQLSVWMKERWRWSGGGCRQQGDGDGGWRHREQLNCPPGVSEVCDHVEFLGEEERSEWLTGDDESVEMASAKLFTVRCGKVEIFSAHWLSREVVYGGERRCWCASILGVGWGW